MSTEALIELDPGPVPAPAPPGPPAHRRRPLGVGCALLLVLALAGAAPAVTLTWRPVGVISGSGRPAAVEVDGERIYVAAAAGADWLVAAWSAHAFHRLWSVRVPMPADANVQLTSAGGQLLVTTSAPHDTSTTVRDGRTGAVRWSVAGMVQPLADGRLGLVQEEQFRPGTEYDDTSGSPGQLFFSSAGRAYAKPPQLTAVRVRELATGRQRWTAQWPGSIFTAKAAPSDVVVASAGRLERRDAATGAIRRERSLSRTPDAAPDWSQVAGDLLLLQHSEGFGGWVSAYALKTLEPRWRIRISSDLGNRGCDGLPCVNVGPTLSVRDPETGAERWQTDQRVDLLVARSGEVLELEGGPGPTLPVRTADPRTGTTVVNLAEWNANALSPSDAPLVLVRNDAGGASFGVLSPGDRAVRSLGRSAEPVTDCRSGDRLVVCGSGAGLAVWRYRG